MKMFLRKTNASVFVTNNFFHLSHFIAFSVYFCSANETICCRVYNILTCVNIAYCREKKTIIRVNHTF